MRPEEKLLIRAIRSASVERQPFWLMRQAGRYLPEYRALRKRAGSFLKLCFDPKLAAEATLQPIRRFGMDAAILFSDILVVPWALGQELTFEEGEGPKLSPVRQASDLARLDEGLSSARLAPVYETVQRVKSRLPQETALIGFAGAPWTVATYMVEGGASRSFEATLGWAAGDEAGFTALIERLTMATIGHLEAQIEAGAEVVQLFDSWAGVLDGEAFVRWVAEPTARIVEALKAHSPGVPVIGFPRGAGRRLLDYARVTGVDAVSLDPEIPLEFARASLQPLVAVQGNLDPRLLESGGPECARRVREIVGALGAGRFIFNLGHGVLPATPVEHVAELARLLRAMPAGGRAGGAA